MTAVRTLQGPPSSELAAALEVFEEQFTYPLGSDGTFRISHAPDYPRFFRAMGECAVFVAEREGQVHGTLGAALRRLRSPDGREGIAGYLGDLKVLPSARGGLTLLRLMRAGLAVNADRATSMFSVVMGGTPVRPRPTPAGSAFPPSPKSATSSYCASPPPHMSSPHRLPQHSHGDGRLLPALDHRRVRHTGW
ncbi:hypothetical protein [Streptomyces sp. NPDC048473]|uniref:hypothetical protein n=1 Tax=unclassified Streptomyces TaxID=2593676 RepID=UPI00371BA909